MIKSTQRTAAPGAKRTSATIANSLNERLWNGRFRRKMAARELGTLNSFQEKS
jgi:hypothetical protein